MSFTIYMATNRINGKRYIGVTGRPLVIRRRQHLRLAATDHRGCPRFYDAIRKYGKESFDWYVLGTEQSRSAAYRLETKKVKELSPEYNVNDGGLGGPGAIAWNRVQIICLEDGCIYDSMGDAAKAYGVGSGDISEVCSGLRRTAANGRHFIKYETPLSESERLALIKELNAMAARERRRRSQPRLDPVVCDGRDRLGRSAAGPMSNARPVICLDDNRSYPSVSAAAWEYKVDKTAVTSLCRGQQFRKTVGGLRFAYTEAI